VRLSQNSLNELCSQQQMKQSLLALVLLSSCVQEMESSNLKGHIIIRHSAGKIVDVYKTTQKVWCERDMQCRIGEDYNVPKVRIFGELKHLRVYDALRWDSYLEYHSEEETLTYEQKLALHKK
jgi:hypothetical protein